MDQIPVIGDTGISTCWTDHLTNCHTFLVKHKILGRGSGSQLADRGHDVEVLTQFDEMSTQLMHAEKDLSYEKPYMVKQSYLDKGLSNKQFAASKN